MPVTLTRAECLIGDAMAATVDGAGQWDRDRPLRLGADWGSPTIGCTWRDNLFMHWRSFTEGTDALASAGRGAPTPWTIPPGPFVGSDEPEARPVELS